MVDSASCWKLDLGEFARIKEQLEKRHQVKLPEAQVRYSDNIKSAFSTTGIELPRHISKERREQLEEINPHKPTIFLARRYPNYPADLYGELWHEFGHVLAHTLDVRDKTLNEGVAYATILVFPASLALQQVISYKTLSNQIAITLSYFYVAHEDSGACMYVSSFSYDLAGFNRFQEVNLHLNSNGSSRQVVTTKDRPSCS